MLQRFIITAIFNIFLFLLGLNAVFKEGNFMYIANPQKLSKDERKQMIKKDIKDFILPAVGASVVCIGLDAIGKEGIKSDSFIKTAKNCAKAYTVEHRDNIKELLEMVKLDKLNKYIDKIGNKTLFAGLFTVSTLFTALAIAGVKQIFFKTNNKNQ